MRHSLASLAGVASFLFSPAASAHADDAATERTALIAADSLAIAAGIVVAATTPDDVDTLGALGRGTATTLGIGLLAGPAVHWSLRHNNQAAMSVALRSLLPLATGVLGGVGLCTVRNELDGCARSGWVVGTAAGTVVAAGLDVAVISMFSDKAERKPTAWYGWQTLTVDALGAGLGLWGYLQIDPAREPEGLVDFPLFQWVGVWSIGTIGAPIIHALHGEWLSAGGSLALRALGGPLLSVGGMVAYCSAVGGEDGCINTGFSWGLMGSAFFMAAIDAALLARESAEREPALDYVGPGVVGDSPGLLLISRF